MPANVLCTTRLLLPHSLDMVASAAIKRQAQKGSKTFWPKCRETLHRMCAVQCALILATGPGTGPYFLANMQNVNSFQPHEPDFYLSRATPTKSRKGRAAGT